MRVISFDKVKRTEFWKQNKDACDVLKDRDVKPYYVGYLRKKEMKKLHYVLPDQLEYKMPNIRDVFQSKGSSGYRMTR